MSFTALIFLLHVHIFIRRKIGLIEKNFNLLNISTASITSSKSLKRKAANQNTEQEAKQALLESGTLATISE